MSASILCLPQSLPEDSALQRALAEALQARERQHQPGLASLARMLARWPRQARFGTWGEALRAAAACPEHDVAVHELNTLEVEADVIMLAAAEPLIVNAGLNDLVAAVKPPELDTETSQTLAAAADRHLAEEGLRVRWLAPRLWRLELSTEIDVRTEPASLIAGRELRGLMPQGPDARRVERWMNELQMLLHAHPLNAERLAGGESPVNAVWLSGFVASEQAKPRAVIELGLAEALERADPMAWVEAWEALAPRIEGVEAVLLGGQEPRWLLRRPPQPRPSVWNDWMNRLRGEPRFSGAWSSLLPRP